MTGGAPGTAKHDVPLLAASLLSILFTRLHRLGERQPWLG